MTNPHIPEKVTNEEWYSRLIYPRQPKDKRSHHIPRADTEHGITFYAVVEALDSKDSAIAQKDEEISKLNQQACENKGIHLDQINEHKEEICRLKGERTKLYGVLKDLHETTCPYKPFATIPSHEEPENIPGCTCSNQKKTRYWATQDFLHRAEISQLKSKIVGMEKFIQEAID